MHWKNILTAASCASRHVVRRMCAPLHVPDPRSWRDSLIASTAMEHGFSLVTRNVADFEGISVLVINPWLPAEPEGA